MNYYLENNQWGAGNIPHSQFASELPTPRWEWDYPMETGGVLGYPAIVTGHKPWAQVSSDPSFPLPLSETFNLKVNWEINTEAEGRFNTAFDLWVTSKKGGGEADITHEVMFWLASQGDNRPAGRQLGTVLGSPYYHATQDNSFWQMPWECISIVLPLSFGANSYPCSVRLGEYLEELVKMGLLPLSGFLASLELGNEIWGGKGKTTVSKYEVAL